MLILLFDKCGGLVRSKVDLDAEYLKLCSDSLKSTSRDREQQKISLVYISLVYFVSAHLLHNKEAVKILRELSVPAVKRFMYI